ncbi:hypothetical protein [Microvirga terricola]|uniref:Uncharacterized protein n=1 Tax=Microvirga terricola TaxID=2719797 RepID=A0ABX0V8B2_9HYPH|nr:hypothetical protein [Microvirga terricola]NIX76090.1 hypothetical protein [Microvirga terricola]
MREAGSVRISRKQPWLLTAVCALLLNPFVLAFFTRPFDFLSFVDMLVTTAIISAVIYLVGFVSGPIGLVLSASFLLHQIVFGLSEDEKELLSCLPNRASGMLPEIGIALLLPASALCTFLLFTRYVLKKPPNPWHAFTVFAVSALMANGALWRISALQREASLVPC